jgi:glycosyltransferase involved in cell wall biosynthesis
MSLKVLIITYYWPPSGGAGVQRWTYFSKNLKKLGVTPIIVTIDPSKAAYPSFDYSFEKEIKDIEVHLTKGGSILNLYSFLKTGSKNRAIPTGDFGNKKKSSFDKLSGFIRGNFFIPDARVGWNKQAYQLAEKVILENKINIVITTGPPHSTHLIGLKLQEKLKIKWISDFRDPWQEVFYNNLFHRLKIADIKDKKLEKLVLEKADTVLTIGPAMKELLSSKIETNKEKVHYLYNGYESELFENLKKETNEKFTISYVGSISTNYHYSVFLESLKKYNPKNVHNFQFLFAGKIDPFVLSEFEQCNSIEITNKGIVSHQDAIQLMKNSDLLLLFLPTFGNTQIMITGKLMEYIATGNPILCIGDVHSDAAKLLENIDNCCSASHVDQDTIIKFLESTYKNSLNSSHHSTTLEQYSRFEITKELITILKSLEN